MKEKFGLIGFGSMGSMIVSQLLEQKIYEEKNVYIADISKEKLENFKKKYKSVNICNNVEVAKNCTNIMISIVPAIVPSILSEIKPYLNEDSYLMISTATVAYTDLVKIYKGKITKFMPTLNSTVKGGVTLVCYNELVQDKDKEYFEQLMSSMSEVIVIGEEDMNLCHNLNGSFPAYISELMFEFAKAAHNHSVNVPFEEIERIVSLSLAGSSRLFIEKNMKFEDTKNSVSTEGSITYEGIKVYEKVLPDMFNEAFDAAMKRYGDITEEVSKIIADSVKQ